MIRITDHVVGDWAIVIWKQGDEIFQQVEAYLFNGLVLIIDPEDFFTITDDESW